MSLKIGELFAGYGGLGMGVQAVIGGEIAWFSEFDAAPSKILAHHFPGVPNHGDITKIDWSTVEPVDVLTGGFPCQDVSLAGARKGLKEGTRSGLWSEFAKAIDALRPGLVVIENVRGLLSAKTVEDIDEQASDMEPGPGGLGELGRGNRPVLNAFGRVLGDLAVLGYEAEWVGLRAADAGAPHGRYRVFIVAHADNPGRGEQWRAVPVRPELVAAEHARDDVAADTDSIRGERRGNDRDVACTPGASEADGQQREWHGDAPDDRQPLDWGNYGPAIERWEAVTGRLAPAPTKADGKAGAARLSPEFVEFLMGLPAGHVTSPAIGITRNEQLKALGNGVVWQQAALAIRHLLERTPPHDD